MGNERKVAAAAMQMPSDTCNAMEEPNQTMEELHCQLTNQTTVDRALRVIHLLTRLSISLIPCLARQPSAKPVSLNPTNLLCVM